MFLLANPLFSRLNGKIPLKLPNADAIIRTGSRIIFSPSRRYPQESPGQPVGDAAMNVVPRASQWDELIRPDRVHGALYSDPAIFEGTLQDIRDCTWVYGVHESE